MASPSHPKERVTFGPFEFDLSSLELRKLGNKIRIQGQPVQILTALIERPNQVVLREELHRLLWRGETFVDFDRGVNVAVNKLRQALGDSSDSPRYIETVPGQGYRFIAPLQHSSYPAVVELPSGALSPQQVEPVRPRGSQSRLFVWLSAAAVICLAGAAWVFWRVRPEKTDPVRFQIAGPEGREILHSAVSPDGRRVVMSVPSSNGRYHLWIRSLDSVEARELPGVDTGIGTPFWSFDSKSVAYGAPGFTLNKIDVTKGAPEVLTTLKGIDRGGTWSPNGTILWGGALLPIRRVSASGGEQTLVTPPTQNTRGDVFPSFLPDGHHFLYVHTTSPVTGTLHLGSIDDPPGENPVALAQVTSAGEPLFLCVAFVPAVDSEAGLVLYLQGSSLMAQPFDTKRLRLAGEKRLMAQKVSEFSASRDTLIYKTPSARSSQLTWINLDGNTSGTVGEPAPFAAFSLSPDGKRVAVLEPGDAGLDMWLMDAQKGTRERFASGVMLNSPVWSSDGKWIFYGLSKDSGVYRKRVEGGSDQELVFPRHEILSIPRSLSRDGRYLLLDAGRHDLGLALLNGGVAGSPPWFMLLPPATFTQMEAELSPDQHRLAYVSDESGRAEVYVRSFSPGKAGKPPSVSKRFLVSKSGGNSPSWRNDGRQLSYFAPGGVVMAVEVRDHPEVPVGEPQVLVKLPAGVKLAALTPDHRRLLAAMPIGSGEPTPITVVRNWQLELKGSQK